MAAPLRVFLCDDVQSFRQLMRYALEDGGEIEVVGEAEDGEAGVEGVKATLPDVVVVDISMPKLDGLAAIPLMRDAAPNTGIVIFSGHEDEAMSEIALERGADRYLRKGADIDEIRATVRAAAEGRTT